MMEARSVSRVIICRNLCSNFISGGETPVRWSRLNFLGVILSSSNQRVKKSFDAERLTIFGGEGCHKMACISHWRHGCAFYRD